MPTSHYRSIPGVMGILDHIPNPISILDVGSGFGKYGVLFREHLDIRKNRCYPKKYWETTIDCVEVWENYITPIHKYVYDRVYLEDIRELHPFLKTYDIIVMADVIEHMEKDEGIDLLNNLLSNNCSGGVVVSYPPILGNEGKKWINPYETHRCVWSKDDFKFFSNVIYKTNQIVYILKEE